MTVDAALAAAQSSLAASAPKPSTAPAAAPSAAASRTAPNKRRAVKGTLHVDQAHVRVQAVIAGDAETVQHALRAGRAHTEDRPTSATAAS